MNEPIKKPNLFRRLFEKRNNDSNLLDPKQWLLNSLGMTKSKTGISISETSAMNYSAVYACVRIISETIASLPLNIYKRDGKNKEKDTKHPLYRALHLRPNPDMTSFAWRELMGVELNTWGNSYNYKLRNTYGDVIGFYPLLANRMMVEIKDNEIIYRYTFNDNIQWIVPKKDILHIPGLSFNGVIGKSPIAMAREAIGLGLALEEFGSRFFSNGTNVGGIAQHPGKLTAQGRDNLTKSINETYQGLGNVHNLMLLEEGMTYQKITIPPNDAQFIESRRFQLEEITRFFRMQLHKVNEMGGATFSNIEHQAIEHVVDTIRPWLVRIEQTINSDDELFPNDKSFAEFVIDGLLRGDTATRFESYVKAIQNGIYCPNDVLEMENRNSYEGGEKHFIALNLQPVEDMQPVTDSLPIETIVEPKAITGASSPKLIEKLGRAYRPLFVNALIRIIKRENTDIAKIFKDKFTTNDLEDYYKKHSEFVSSQIKPVVYAFAEAIGAEIEVKESDITIFSDNYSNDFVKRYTDNHLEVLKAGGHINMDEELFSSEEILRISKAFTLYIQKIG